MLKFGLNLRFRNPTPWLRPWAEVYADNLQVARLAEELGFDGIWVPEHHSSPDGYNPTPFVVLGAIASATKHLQLGTQMLLLPLHNPVLAAEEACAVDVISNGRLNIGIGAGYRKEDFTSLGVERAARRTMMDEGVDLFYRVLTEKAPFSYKGEHYRVSNVDIEPRSVQQPHPPVFISVRSKSAAQRAAQYGFSANILVRQGDATALYDSYIGALQTVGADVSRCEIATVGDGFIARTEEEARIIAREYMSHDAALYAEMLLDNPDRGDRLFIEAGRSGNVSPPMTPDAWAKEIESAVSTFERGPVKLGWFNVSVWPPGLPTEQAIQALRLFAATVLPRFR